MIFYRRGLVTASSQPVRSNAFWHEPVNVLVESAHDSLYSTCILQKDFSLPQTSSVVHVKTKQPKVLIN